MLLTVYEYNSAEKKRLRSPDLGFPHAIGPPCEVVFELLNEHDLDRPSY